MPPPAARRAHDHHVQLRGVGHAHAVSSTSATNTVTGSLPTTSYAYDGAGDTTTLGAQTLTWTPNGNLATAGTAASPASYAYDADGNELVENDSGSATTVPAR